ncbi:hypothetical protein [Salinirubrum litoreum]|uniref:DUF8215 domain-containing protein n=1 Tax=Salinirubrum litoreum TaxID=1126234 RepID=A0ABD5RA00_9EURY|nr:hypothetical protein [Salinirubrum litoreum]
MTRGSEDSLTARFDRWLDYAFFGGAEVTVLGLPVLLTLMVAPNPVTVSLSAMTALTVSTVTVATLRGGWIDVGEWPAFGDFYSLPLRAAYYGGVLGFTAYAGSLAQLSTGSPWPGIIVPTACCAVLLALFPRVVDRLQRVSRFDVPF